MNYKCIIYSLFSLPALCIANSVLGDPDLNCSAEWTDKKGAYWNGQEELDTKIRFLRILSLNCAGLTHPKAERMRFVL